MGVALPSFHERFNPSNLPLWPFPILNVVKFYAVPIALGWAAWHFKVSLTDSAAQLIGASVAVFSALFFVVMIPFAELRIKASAQADSDSQNFVRFLGYALATVRAGLSVALICFLALLLLAMCDRNKETGTDPRIIVAVSAFAVTMAAFFVSTIVVTILDTFSAYGNHPA